jgi:mono/diheme cytochrome c family protein
MALADSAEVSMRLAVVLLVVASASVAAQDLSVFTRWVWDGVYTSEQARRGQNLYMRHCATCHSGDMAGRSAVPAQPPNVEAKPGAPALKGNEFIANWNDLPLESLFERIRISMPQQAPGSLSRQQNADILSYVLQENNFTAGNAELPTTKDALTAIRIGR